jgi:hypothetical protein
MELTGSEPMPINRKRGQGSAWTVAPAEEKDVFIQQHSQQSRLVFSIE